jgi:hypothetical protein
MTSDGPQEKRARNACPYCGEPLGVGFGDFLPTKRSGPAIVKCLACKGTARVATSAQIAGVAGLILGLLGGAIASARLITEHSQQSTLLALGGAMAGAFLLSYTLGYTFLRFEPFGEPPSRAAVRDRTKRGRRRKK